MKLKGIFTIKSYSKDGVLVDIIKKNNIVVRDGLFSLALFINGGAVDAYPDISIGTGTSSDGVSIDDASLFMWYADAIASVDWVYPNIAIWSGTFNFTETVTITEMAVTKSTHTILFNHILLDIPREYHSGEFMVVEYQLEFLNN